MANVITVEEQRKFPLNRPQGWSPKLPRWTLKLPSSLQELAVAYIGIQCHTRPHEGSTIQRNVADVIETWLTGCSQTLIVTERFEVVSGRDVPDGTWVWVTYWSSKAGMKSALAHLKLRQLWDNIGAENRPGIGIWSESFSPDLTRFETNYAGTDYCPGLAQLADTEHVEHTLTGYWGAARDRMYASAYDDFPGSSSTVEQPNFQVKSLGRHLVGTNRSTIAHIRSGQFWEECSEEESDAYEKDLEPHLRNGLDDIEKRPQDLGDFGLRFLRNTNHFASSARPRKETCAAGFFRGLSDLESWAKDCPSHHKIYGGSIHHRNRFAKDAKMRTWHEICVLKPGEAEWEYINCVPYTGTIPFQPMEATSNDM